MFEEGTLEVGSLQPHPRLLKPLQMTCKSPVCTCAFAMLHLHRAPYEGAALLEQPLREFVRLLES